MASSSRALILRVLTAAACSTGLMFQSHNTTGSFSVTGQWDTWVFVENGTYYVYYLVTERSPGEGFGVATSPDGQHWTDYGFVFHGPSWTEHRWWEGSGSVWRAPDYATSGRYLINWSQDPGGYQNLTFGQSFDLIHWTPLDVAPTPAPASTLSLVLSLALALALALTAVPYTHLDPTPLSPVTLP